MFETYLLNLLYLTILLVTLYYLYFKHASNYFVKVHIPYLEPTFPFGNAKSFVLVNENVAETFRNFYNDLKVKTKLCGAGGIFIFAKPHLVIVSPELVKCVLSKDFANFHDRSLYVDEENDPLSGNLLALKGLKWKKLRAKITPTFTSGKMKMMFSTIVACSKELGDILDDHTTRKIPLDIRDLFARLAMDTIASCAFGIDCNSLKNPENEFRKHAKEIFKFSLRDTCFNILADLCPAILRYFKITQTPQDLTDFFMGVLKQTIEYREKNNVTRKDFLDLMIRLKNKQSVWEDLEVGEEGITFNELAAQAFVFFAAGFETSASTLNFCIYELCENVDVQKKVREEVWNVLGKHKGDLTYDAVMDMKYMDKVFQEVLRKYPPISIIGRECTAEYKIPNTDAVIEKETEVFISTLGLHHDPEYYPNPDKFDPNRFTEEEKSKRHPFTYLPFGEGPRICIGMRFALLQVKIVLATLLKEYEFSLHADTKTPIKFDSKNVFLCPVDTILVEAKKIII